MACLSMSAPCEHETWQGRVDLGIRPATSQTDTVTPCNRLKPGMAQWPLGESSQGPLCALRHAVVATFSAAATVAGVAGSRPAR